MYFLIIFILILIYLFFIVNSIIWLKDKTIININDKIIKYVIYIDCIIYTLLLLFLIYLYLSNKTIKIL
jgi:hypothetical protein